MRIVRGIAKAFTAGVLCAVLAACANVAGRAPNSDIYDLGIGEPLGFSARIVPAAIEVRAPSWLGSAAMQYRFEFRQPPQRRVYAESRWASPPAEMLERRLRRAFASDRHVSGGEDVAPGAACRIRIELDELLQSFASPTQSEGVLLARASLLPPRGEQPLATHLIAIREPAVTPDAPGGVIAHQAGAARLAQDLAAWLERIADGNGAAAARCR